MYCFSVQHCPLPRISRAPLGRQQGNGAPLSSPAVLKFFLTQVLFCAAAGGRHRLKTTLSPRRLHSSAHVELVKAVLMSGTRACRECGPRNNERDAGLQTATVAVEGGNGRWWLGRQTRRRFPNGNNLFRTFPFGKTSGHLWAATRPVCPLDAHKSRPLLARIFLPDFRLAPRPLRQSSRVRLSHRTPK